MSNETNGNGTGGDDRDLVRDLDDWIFAGRGVVQVMGSIGRLVPPLGRHREAEFGLLIAAAHGEFERLVATFETIIRPALERHADHSSSPGWQTAGVGKKRYEASPPPPLANVDGADFWSIHYWVSHWVDGSNHLLATVEGMREYVPPADEYQAWSLTSFHIPRVDEAFAWVVDGYRQGVRPRLERYERRPRR